MWTQSFGRQAGRQNNYDLLRIISTIAVILIHVNWRYFGSIYTMPEVSFVWGMEAIINIVTRFSVPVFMMLSGAFILQNAENGKAVLFYKKSLKKIFIPFIVAVLILIFYQVVENIVSGAMLLTGLKSLIGGGFYNLWYVYTLACIYSLTPFIIRLRQVISWKQYKTLAWVMVIWAVISQATSTQSWAYSIGVVFAFISYYLLGDVIRHEIEAEKRVGNLLLIALSIVSIAVSYFVRAKGFNYYTLKAYVAFFSPTTVLFAICIFILFGQLTVRMECYWLAGYTFEIYLFHMPVLKLLGLIVDQLKINILLKELLLLCLTFLGALVIAIGFKRLCRLVVKSEQINRILQKLDKLSLQTGE